MNIENMLTNGMSGAAGSLLGGIFGAIGAKKQFQRQKKLMQMQSQMEMDNWQKQFDAQNAYNDPSAQLERLEAAGINPLTQDGGFVNTSEGASGASVGLPSPSVPDYSSFADIGNNLQEAAFRQKENDRADRHQDNEDRLTDVQIEQAYSVIENYNANTKHTEEDTKNAIESRNLIIANTKKVFSDIESSNVSTQLAIQDLALRQYQTQIDEKYKAGMLDIEGRRNDLTADANSIKRAELAEKRREFNEQVKLEREKFTEDIKNQRWDRIEKAMDNLHYETIGGVVTGISPESLYIANGLLQALGTDGSKILPSSVGTVDGSSSGTAMSVVGTSVDFSISLYRKLDTFYKDLQQIQTASTIPSVDAVTGVQ